MAYPLKSSYRNDTTKHCFGKCYLVNPAECSVCKIAGACGVQTDTREIDRERRKREENRRFANHLSRYGYPYRYILAEIEERGGGL